MQKMKYVLVFTVLALLFLVPAFVLSQVHGSSGTEGSASPPIKPPEVKASALAVAPIPLPGQRAPDFELAAVKVGDIQKIKLSDSHGKWRFLIFFPAAFTFV